MMTMIRKYFHAVTLLVALCCAQVSCTEKAPSPTPGQPEPETPTTKPSIERGTFAKGADVSWLTQMESEGLTFKNKKGATTECMKLLKEDCGVNAIRLRVWVNPVEGWNNIYDVLVKARRADALGLRLMIDFHFSDTWADPGQQAIPAAWTGYSLSQTKTAVASHVKEMLTLLKKFDIEPEWVQIGNETRLGMLWPLGHLDTNNGANYAELTNAGYDAVKAIFPDAKVIVHVDCGNELWLYTNLFDKLKAHGGKYDMIGMSLYPESSNWSKMVDDCVSNISTVSQRYNVPVMVCEIGMDYNLADICKQCISTLMSKGRATGRLEGIFYWEPQAPANYNGGYNKGCFNQGKPTVALDAFTE